MYQHYYLKTAIGRRRRYAGWNGKTSTQVGTTRGQGTRTRVSRKTKLVRTVSEAASEEGPMMCNIPVPPRVVAVLFVPSVEEDQFWTICSKGEGKM